MKNKLIFPIIACSLLAAGTLTNVVVNKNTFIQKAEATSTRTLTIDMTKYATNASGNTTVNTTAGNKIGIYYYMNRRGIYNTTKFGHLTSVQIYYTTSSLEPGSAYVVFGSSKEPSGTQTMRSSGATVNNTNSSYGYFKVGQATEESISLTKIVIKYEC